MALLVLVAILAASMPIPLATKRVALIGAESFPCQSCHCGCATAEQCWTNCCCFSPAERRRWAEAQGVTPPAYAVLDSSFAEAAISGRANCETSHQLCHSAPADCCAQHAAEGAASPATTDEECHFTCAESPDSQAAAQATETVWVLSVVATKCRSGATEFTLLPWAVVESLNWTIAFPTPLLERLVLGDMRISDRAAPPPAPPPEPASAACSLGQVS